jgi:hypothetical protein
MLEFPADRYRRAGATDQEIETLETKFAGLPDPGKHALITHVGRCSDYTLIEELAHGRRKADDSIQRLLAGTTQAAKQKHPRTKA